MRKLLARFRPGSLPDKGGSLPEIGGTPVILHFGDTPTLHYYWKSRFPDAVYLDTANARPTGNALAGASSLVLVRHVAPAWARLLRSEQEALPPVFYFLDDDIPGILGDPHLPLGYAMKTAARYFRLRRPLAELNVSILPATPGLATRYGLPASSVLSPLPLAARFGDGDDDSRYDENRQMTVFYHGTASHEREIRWLKEVFAGVSSCQPGTVFEVFGGDRIRRFYKGMGNVRVVHPMGWSEFLAYTSSVRLDIGLAPLLDSPFNACRSHVKYYDITRTGGVGVYSRGEVFDRAVRHGDNGLLAANTPDAWVDAICRLVADFGLRRSLYRNAMADVAGCTGSGGGLP